MSTSSTSGAPQSGTGKKHTAGAYDVRTVIGALIGFCGLVLVLMGAVDASGAEIDKAGGVNANLWTGIAMVAFAIVIGLWTWLRPVVVDPSTIDDANDLSKVNH